MLVDLVRNDMVRVLKKCYCDKFLKVDKYFNVMYLVLRVVGELKKGCDSLYVYRSFMNVGMFSGVFKIFVIRFIY